MKGNLLDPPVPNSSDGEEALAAIQAETPRLVVLDVMMPKKNGFDVCHTVKRELGMDGILLCAATDPGFTILHRVDT